MTLSRRTTRIALAFIHKDWIEFKRAITLTCAGLLIPVILLSTGSGRADFIRGLLAGGLMASPFLFAQSCFQTERQTGTLEFLRGLPITAWDLIGAKYASLFSMILFTVNTPLILSGDRRLILEANALALFMGSVFMAATIVSEKPWAAQLPFWFVTIVVAPGYRLVEQYYPNGVNVIRCIAEHRREIAILALVLTPVIVIVSAAVFVTRSRE